MRRLAATVAIALAGASAATAHARPGAIDRSFGDGGYRELSSGVYFEAEAMAIDRVGGIYVAGTLGGGQSQYWVVRRLHRSGRIDRRFRRVLIQPRAGAYGGPVAIRVHPSGGVLIAGNVDPGGDGADEVAVVRLGRTGRPVASFGDNGVAWLRVPVGAGVAATGDHALHVSSKGMITVAGSTNPLAREVLLARFTAAGVLDTRFGGGDGVVTSDLGLRTADPQGRNLYPRGLGVLPDGRLVVVAQRDDGGGVLGRFAADGEFTGAGPVAAGAPRSVRFRSDGSASAILVRGEFTGLRRFAADGTPGRVRWHRLSGGNLAARDRRGGFYVLGNRRLHRLRPDGRIDRRFRWRTPGFLRDYDYDSKVLRAAALDVDPRHAVVLMGSVYEDTRIDYTFVAMHLSRYLGVR